VDAVSVDGASEDGVSGGWVAAAGAPGGCDAVGDSSTGCLGGAVPGSAASAAALSSLVASVVAAPAL
jgi:hypothetical protein